MEALGMQRAHTTTGYSGATNMQATAIVPPPSPNSLAGALSRLQHALDANSELITAVSGKLDTAGVMKPSVPTADVSNTKNGIGNESQLGAHINNVAQMFENNNGRLADLVNRIDG